MRAVEPVAPLYRACVDPDEARLLRPKSLASSGNVRLPAFAGTTFGVTDASTLSTRREEKEAI
jgi:hypothetical protein